jgi:hypothetical protein
MGWSCSAAANRTLETIEAACEASREGKIDENVSNVFYADGRRYFYELDRQEHDDGGITGDIIESPGDTDTCRKVGTFRIDGDGTLSRGPRLFHDA